MKAIRIQADAIVDEASLHRVFAAAMGFPGFYGENWNAWIDCMSCLTDPGAGMTAFHLAPDEELRIELAGGEAFRQRCPRLFQDLVECADSVNARFAGHGEGARLLIDVVDAG